MHALWVLYKLHAGLTFMMCVHVLPFTWIIAFDAMNIAMQIEWKSACACSTTQYIHLVMVTYLANL